MTGKVPPAGGSGPPAAPDAAARQRIYLAALRRGGGELPWGWLADRARAWNLSPSTVSEELVAAREALAAARTPAATRKRAHDLVVEAAEIGEQLHRAALTAPAGQLGALERRARVLATAAGMKRRAAAELRAWADGGPIVEPVPNYSFGDLLKAERANAERLKATSGPSIPFGFKAKASTS
jgi:hypothetical protein